MNKRKLNIKFFRVFGCRCYLLNVYEDVGKLKAKGDIGVLELGLSNLNETGKSSNRSVLKVDEALKNDLEDLIQDFYDEYFDSSKIMKSSTTNVETSINNEVFYEISESFQGESSSSSLNDGVQQSPEEVILPSLNTHSIPINMVPNGDEFKWEMILTQIHFPSSSTTYNTQQHIYLSQTWILQRILQLQKFLSSFTGMSSIIFVGLGELIGYFEGVCFGNKGENVWILDFNFMDFKGYSSSGAYGESFYGYDALSTSYRRRK
nr:hypothetical protein [Tanacetum cinerariifolium]